VLHGAQRGDAAVTEALVVATEADVDRGALQPRFDFGGRELDIAVRTEHAELAQDERSYAGRMW
jgi:hypothetical protein